jgi:hypothetical protein
MLSKAEFAPEPMVFPGIFVEACDFAGSIFV